MKVIIAMLAIALFMNVTFESNGGVAQETHESSYLLEVIGTSMTPCFSEGRLIRVFPTREPGLGDSVVVQCNVDKCRNEKVHKYLLGKKDNCIYLRGCNKFSFDSSTYGWLCGDEYTMKGVSEELRDK